jgi:uncharacterized membrane protein YdjX (TVP38/TMEM64 family)
MTRLLLLILVITGITLVALYREHIDVAALESWVQQAGAAGPLLFMLIYAIATVLFLPGSLLTLAGGALFGPLWGTLYNLTGATLGATMAFFVSRYLASSWVERKSRGTLKQLKQGVENEGWRFVALVRLVPLFPFNLLNYALGLTRIRLSHYIIASYLCMLPGAIAYTYLGYAGREAVTSGEGLVRKGLLALALLALVLFLPRLISRLRQNPIVDIADLKQRMDNGENVFILDVRNPEEFSGEQGHIAGAVNIPLDALPQRLDEVSHESERAVILICRTDRRSSQAAQLLARSGFADVHVAKGGMTDWHSNGFPIER